MARPLAFVLRFSLPLCRVAQKINAAILRAVIPRTVQPHVTLTDADYQELLEMAYQQGALAQSEKEIILQIISLDRRTAKEVMKPRSQMAAISDDLSIEEMIAAARKHKHRRLPIYDETPDTIVGILNTRALLLDPQIDLADAIEFPSFVPETMNLLQLFKSLQRQQRGLAIVLDEFGGTAGIVTMEDILEEVIGKIRGEAEAEGFVMEKLGPGRWRVAGTLRLDDFRREYPALGDVPEVETMGGLLTSLLDVVPGRGESATFCGLKLTAQVADERRVRELLGGGDAKYKCMDARDSLIWVVFVACLAVSFRVVGHGGGGVCAEPVADSAADARRQGHRPRCCTTTWRTRRTSCGRSWSATRWPTSSSWAGWWRNCTRRLGDYRVWFVVVFSVAVFLFYAFFDLLPKMLFRMYPNRLCLLLARPFRFIHLALRPLVALVETFSGVLLRWRGGKAFTGHLFGNREELRLVMQESAQAFSSEERTMINRVLDLQTLTVRQVMKPLEQAVAMTAQTPVSAALALCRERKLTRLPVWESRDGGQRIIGMLALNTLLYQPALDASKPVRRIHEARAVPGRRPAAGSGVAAVAAERAAAGDCAGPRTARDRHPQLCRTC